MKQKKKVNHRMAYRYTEEQLWEIATQLDTRYLAPPGKEHVNRDAALYHRVYRARVKLGLPTQRLKIRTGLTPREYMRQWRRNRKAKALNEKE